MKFIRSSGILLHPTSLPGRYGIGDFGEYAYQWIDFLAECGCSTWQILPLGPTGYGDSPYQSFSAFAGNPYLINPDHLLADELLISADLTSIPAFPIDHVDFAAVIPYKLHLLERAYTRFQQNPPLHIQDEFAAFEKEQAYWLDDFSLFMAIKDANQGMPWNKWDTPLKWRNSLTLKKASQKYHQSIQQHRFNQFLFFRQWSALHQYANKKGIKIIGDIPIFVAHDSADVWAKPELFHLNEQGEPTVVAGVPPDYFSPTGQLWGNPIYKWEIHAQSGYEWWMQRICAALKQVDILRIDHFRGFVAHWEVPANETTAINGQWVSAPGADFFRTVTESLGELPIIAEDLGFMTPEVIELRKQFNLPGMKVLVFAFDSGPDNPFLPHNFTQEYIVYTGTHDNDTARGWFDRVGDTERQFARRYLNSSGEDISWDLIRAAWASVAIIAIAPMQDVLSLDNRARMNYPGQPSGNWTWRMSADALSKHVSARLQEMNYLYGRNLTK